MSQNIQDLLLGIAGALITAIFGYFSNSHKDDTDREDIYASHTKDLWEKIDHQSEEIRQLNSQITQANVENVRLNNQVKKLTTENARLADQIKELNARTEAFTKLEEGRKKHENSNPK